MNIFSFNTWKHGKKLFILLALIMPLFLILSMVNRIIYCDITAQRRLVQTPSGVSIPKIDFDIPTLKFNTLSTVCQYEENKINCPDVRHKGETMIRQVHLAILRMMKVIDLICTKHSIDYFIMSGTLLGAYRDKGFIAWDNDADIGLLEEDYEKLLQIIEKDLPKDIFFQEGSTINNKYQAAKLRDNRSCYCHCIRTGCKGNDGLQVDIFVFKRLTNDRSRMRSKTNGRFTLNYDDVVPTKRLEMEGISLSVPKNSEKVLEIFFGANYMTPLSNKCPEYGFIAMPWHSCEYIEALSEKDRQNLIIETMVHDSWFFWFFG